MPTYSADGKRLVTGYIPKQYLSIIGLVVFGLLSVVFWIRLWRNGRRFMLTLCIGTSTMMIGFITRIPFHNSPDSLGVYIIQSLLILLSPCAFLANNYIILPRLATWLDAENCLFLSSRKIVRIFVWSDVITFILQAGGSGLTAVQDEKLKDIGHWVTIGGLVAQLASFYLFCVLLVLFGWRVRSRTPWKWSREITTKTSPNISFTTRFTFLEDWRTLYWAVLWSCIGLMIRCVFRIVEYAQGYDGSLRTTEVYFYVLDALPLALGISVFTVVWPAVSMTTASQPFAGENPDGIAMERRGVEPGNNSDDGLAPYSKV